MTRGNQPTETDVMEWLWELIAFWEKLIELIADQLIFKLLRYKPLDDQQHTRNNLH